MWQQIYFLFVRHIVGAYFLSSVAMKKKARKEERKQHVTKVVVGAERNETEVTWEKEERRGESRGRRDGERPDSLYEFLVREGLYYPKEIIEHIETILKTPGLRKVFLLRGIPGVGKTELAFAVARYLNAEPVFFQCTTGTSEDELLYKYLPSEETKSGIELVLGPLPQALVKSNEGPVVLILDEFDKTRPSADALLLDFLQNYRLALYLGGNKTVIEGNPENLVVFLTSNDMREFSEALMRRVRSITLPPLPAKMVYKILEKRFDEGLAKLLTQIYIDTLNAGLRKPATIQELIQLGEVIKNNPNISLEYLIRSEIVKFDDDWERYVNYVKARGPVKHFSFKEEKTEKSEEKSEDIANKYMPAEDTDKEESEEEEAREEEESEDESGKKITAGTVIKKMQLKVKKVESEAEPKVVTEEQEVYMKLEDKDKEMYTHVIKRLEPEPQDDATSFGKFRLVYDPEENKTYIVSVEPLTLSELYNLDAKGEYYAVDEVLMTDGMLRNLIRRAERVRKYSINSILLEFKTFGDDLMRVLIDKLEKIDDGIYRAGITVYISGERSRFNDVLEEIIRAPQEYFENLLEKAFKELDPRKHVRMIERLIDIIKKNKELIGKFFKYLKISISGFEKCYLNTYIRGKEIEIELPYRHKLHGKLWEEVKKRLGKSTFKIKISDLGNKDNEIVELIEVAKKVADEFAVKKHASSEG